MSETIINRWLGQWRARLRGSLAKRLVWMTDERRGLDGELISRFAWVAVIGREHYEVAQQRYPVRGWFDLRRVLKLEPQAREALVCVGPLEGDSREVTFHRLSPNLPREQLRALFWVPETWLLSTTAREHGVIAVERHGLRYFLAANGASLVAGGAIRDPRVFALAAGVSVRGDPPVMDGEALRGGFLAALSDLSTSIWWSLRSPTAAEHVKKFLQPAAVFTTLAIVLYLGLASVYLATAEFVRTRQLEALGPEVSQLLRDQRAVGQIAAERDGLATVLASAEPVWPVWEVAATVWRFKGAIYGFNVSGDRLTVRCTAPEATAVLEALRTLKGFSDARFDTAVRQGGVGQEFVVTLRRVGASGSKAP